MRSTVCEFSHTCIRPVPARWPLFWRNTSFSAYDEQPAGSEVTVPLWSGETIITLAVAIVAVLIPIVVFFLLSL